MSEILVKNEGNMDEDLNLSKHQLNLACEIKAPMQADARGLRASANYCFTSSDNLPENTL